MSLSRTVLLKRDGGIGGAVVSGFVFVLNVVLMASVASGDRPPNVLMIFSDDQGMNDVGCYGSEIPTPHLDRLAEEGLRFEQFYAASSICTPSRFGLLTGRFAHRSKDSLTTALMFLDSEDRRRGIRVGETTFATQLHQSGYHTHLVGKWHLGHGDRSFWPTRHGFDTFFGHTGGCVDFFTLRYGNTPDWYRDETLDLTDGYVTEVITAEADRLIRSHTGDDSPWFVHVSYNAPHFGKGFDWIAGRTENVMQPSAEDLRCVEFIDDPLRRAFAAKVVGMDRGIGRLMAALRETGQVASTLVVFMSDHGGDPRYGGSNTPFRGGKATLYEGGVRVPCIVRWPGHVAAGKTTDAIASALDWYPTLVEIAETSHTNQRATVHSSTPQSLDGQALDGQPLDGQSLLPLLSGSTTAASSWRHRPIVWRTGSHASLDRQSWLAVRDGRWKYVAPPDTSPQLFDIVTDPQESNDVIESHPQVATRLSDLANLPDQTNPTDQANPIDQAIPTDQADRR